MSAEKTNQFEYLGRWVDKANFCAFVYNEDSQKLAKTYDEYEQLIGSGLWFPSKELINPKENKVASKPTLVESPPQNKRAAIKNLLKNANNVGN